MIIQKSVLFLAEPQEVAKEVSQMLLTQVQTLGTVDIPAVEQLILSRSKMVHSRRILSGLALEVAQNVQEYVDAENREMESEMAEAVIKELKVQTRTMQESIIEAGPSSIVGHDK